MSEQTCKFCGTVATPADERNCSSLEDAWQQTPTRPYGCPWFDADSRKSHPRPMPTAAQGAAQPVAWRYTCQDGSEVLMLKPLTEEQKRRGYYTGEDGEDEVDGDEALVGPLHWAQETPLYEHPPQVTEGQREWISPIKTVSDLVNNLLTLDQSMQVHGAYFLPDGIEDRCRTRGLSLSREHVVNGRIKRDDTVPYSLVIWTAQQETTS